MFISFVTLFQHKHMKAKKKLLRFKNKYSYLLRVCHFSGGADNVGIQALYSRNNRQTKNNINCLHGCVQTVLITIRLCARARRRALVWKSNLLRVLMDLRQIPKVNMKKKEEKRKNGSFISDYFLFIVSAHVGSV